MSESLSSTKVGRPWLHWPELGVASISRRSAFISSARICRPDRTEPWQAMRDRIAWARSRSVSDAPISASSSRMSRRSARASTGPEDGGRLAHRDGPGAEGLEMQAQAREAAGMVEKALRVGGRQLDDLGDEERLGGHARRLHLAFSFS
jgi:hypothetical protein